MKLETIVFVLDNFYPITSGSCHSVDLIWRARQTNAYANNYSPVEFVYWGKGEYLTSKWPRTLRDFALGIEQKKVSIPKEARGRLVANDLKTDGSIPSVNFVYHITMFDAKKTSSG